MALETLKPGWDLGFSISGTHEEVKLNLRRISVMASKVNTPVSITSFLISTPFFCCFPSLELSPNRPSFPWLAYHNRLA